MNSVKNKIFKNGSIVNYYSINQNNIQVGTILKYNRTDKTYHIHDHSTGYLYDIEENHIKGIYGQEILSQQDKEFLSELVSFYNYDILYITRHNRYLIGINNNYGTIFNIYDKQTRFKNMINDVSYSLKELGISNKNELEK